MTKHDNPAKFSRRAVLMGAGALVVSVGAPVGVELLMGMNEAFAQNVKPPLTPEQLSSYIAINADGSVESAKGAVTPENIAEWMAVTSALSAVNFARSRGPLSSTTLPSEVG